MKSSFVSLIRATTLLTVVCASQARVFGRERPLAPSFDFKGRLLVALSDADMVASAYDNGNLGSVDGADALSVIRLGAPKRAMGTASLGVSNSVTGPPASVVVTPDGKYAIVIEVRGKRPLTKAHPKLADLPVGQSLFVVDLSRPDRPRVTQRLKSFSQPYSVSINSQGSLVAVSFGPL